MVNLMGVINATTTTTAIQTNVSCTCNCKRSTSLQSLEISQLEFVQILVIVVVMMVMVVVITCLLNHYRLSARPLLSRHAHARRRHLPLANEGGLWSSEGPASGLNEVYTPRPPDRGVPPSYPHPHHHHPRFQPTYPYLPQGLIDLPPTISLSDGEEPPPYQGPCTLQLRDPEQQLELNRESVRAPPNRTVYDSHLLHHHHHHGSSSASACLQTRLQAPPPSVNAGISALEAQEGVARQKKQGAGVDGAPPAYSEVIGHYYHPTSLDPHLGHRTVPPAVPPPPPPPASLIHGLLRPPPPPQQAPPTPGNAVENRNNTRNAKEKSHKPQQV